jgi:hypothetical protein
MLVFKKIRNIVFTEDNILIFNDKEVTPRYIYKYADIMGLTISLLQGA